jgi:hypothetical protein
MVRHSIDRWADTAFFRCMLLVSGLVVVPVLAAGALTTVIGIAAVMIDRSPVDLSKAVFALLSVGGALGFVGYVRAHMGVQKPHRHNVTATIVCLAAGVISALVVAIFALTGAFDAWGSPLSSRPWVAFPLLFALANLVWAASGIAWMQRLPSTYVEKTGRVFDGVPVVLLLVAITLAIAAALKTITL